MIGESEWSEFIRLFLQAVLLIIIPLLASLLIRYMRTLLAKATSELTSSQLDTLQMLVRNAVSASEQIGNVENLTGGEKRDLAIAMIEKMLGDHGINAEVEHITSLIEAEVLRQFNDPSLASNLPSTKLEIIQEVIGAAITAAEQSGLDQATGNILDKKFNYALKVATRYFEELRLSIDGNLLKNLLATGLNRKTLDIEQKNHLIFQSVESAVFAAEQSGLAGLFQNDGRTKKSYAMHFLKEQLRMHGIAVEDSVLSGLIEAQVGKNRNIFNQT